MTSSAIAAIWTPKRIHLAAEKVYAADKLHFAVASLLPEGVLDVLDIITTALKEDGDMPARIGAVTAALIEPLTTTIEALQVSHPDDFKKLAGKDALDILFIAKHQGQMTLVRCGFKAKRRGKGVLLDLRRVQYPNAATDIASQELMTAGLDDAAAVAFKGSTSGQEALVYPEKTLVKFRDIAAKGAPLEVVKLSDAGAEYSNI
jgi:hypothetical protein